MEMKWPKSWTREIEKNIESEVSSGQTDWDKIVRKKADRKPSFQGFLNKKRGLFTILGSVAVAAVITLGLLVFLLGGNQDSYSQEAAELMAQDSMWGSSWMDDLLLVTAEEIALQQ